MHLPAFTTMLQFYIYNLTRGRCNFIQDFHSYNFTSSSIACQVAYLNLKIIIALSLVYRFLYGFLLQHCANDASAIAAAVKEPAQLLRGHGLSAALQLFDRCSLCQFQLRLPGEILLQALADQLLIRNFFGQLKGHFLPSARMKGYSVMDPAAAVSLVIQIVVFLQKADDCVGHICPITFFAQLLHNLLPGAHPHGYITERFLFGLFQLFHGRYLSHFRYALNQGIPLFCYLVRLFFIKK